MFKNIEEINHIDYIKEKLYIDNDFVSSDNYSKNRINHLVDVFLRDEALSLYEKYNESIYEEDEKENESNKLFQEINKAENIFVGTDLKNINYKEYNTKPIGVNIGIFIDIKK